MADQISYEHPIWDLTPTELNIAYLSLTLTKREIAAALSLKESTVGTHLTNIFTKLGLSAYPDEEKRPRLIENFGSNLESIVAEVQGDYQGEYRLRRKEALNKRSEIAEQKQAAEIPHPQPTMHEEPPLPQTQTGPAVPTGTILIGAGVLACLLFIGIAGFLWQRFSRPPIIAPATGTISTPTQILTPTAPIHTTTPKASSTPENSPTPEATATLETTPTPLPFPGRENFDVEYSSLWTPIGDPFLSVGNRYWGADGILTVRENTTGGLAIGNTGWTDYVITLNALYFSYGPYKLDLSVRVKNLDNRIILSCQVTSCIWIVVYEGQVDELSQRQTMQFRYNFIMTVQGNTFSVVGDDVGTKRNMQLILPPKYEDKFPGGGVMVEISNFSLDYIEIQPYP